MAERTRKRRGGPGIDAAFRTRQGRPQTPSRQRLSEWTLREIRLIERYYPSMSIQAFQARYLPHRSVLSIKSRASLLGVHQRPRWTRAETALLRKHYLSFSAAELRRRYLPLRTERAIWHQAELLGLKPQTEPRHRWTAKDIALLKREWTKPGGRERVAKQMGLPVRIISSRAAHLRVYRKRDNHWTKREDAILRKQYLSLGTRVPLQDRSAQAIVLRARILGLRRFRRTPWNRTIVRWTPAEDDVMRRHRSLRVKQLLSLLPRRNAAAIQMRRQTQPELGYIPAPFQRAPWKTQEIAVLRRHSQLGPTALAELLPGRSVSAIRAVKRRVKRA